MHEHDVSKANGASFPSDGSSGEKCRAFDADRQPHLVVSEEVSAASLLHLINFEAMNMACYVLRVRFV